jgi:hypothetical protein
MQRFGPNPSGIGRKAAYAVEECANFPADCFINIERCEESHVPVIGGRSSVFG